MPRSFRVGNNETAMFHLDVLLDPLSDMAQKRAPLLKWLAAMGSVHITVQLNPVLQRPDSEVGMSLPGYAHSLTCCSYR